MRVALTHAFCWPEVRRGAERLVAELAGAVAGLGHEVTVISSAWSPGRETADGVTWIKLRRAHDDVAAAERAFGSRILPTLATGRWDVVHSHGRHDGVASLRARRLHRRRAVVHTDIGRPLRSWWARHPAEAPAAERVIAGADAYCCMSRHSLELLARDYGRAGELLPGGVDLDRFRPAAARTPAPTILYSGAIDEPRKGVAGLLAALPLVADAVPGVRLLLSGPGDATPLLAAAPPAARDRTDVVGLGTLAEQPERYGRAWVCALPSTDETFGLVLVEALACGTPVVAADAAGLPELVDPGATGALCRPGEPESIARACVEALELAAKPDTADRCRDAARPFDWRTGVAPRAVEIYERALSSRP